VSTNSVPSLHLLTRDLADDHARALPSCSTSQIKERDSFQVYAAKKTRPAHRILLHHNLEVSGSGEHSPFAQLPQSSHALADGRPGRRVVSYASIVASCASGSPSSRAGSSTTSALGPWDVLRMPAASMLCHSAPSPCARSRDREHAEANRCVLRLRVPMCVPGCLTTRACLRVLDLPS
jgi:hypothetical protein